MELLFQRQSGGLTNLVAQVVQCCTMSVVSFCSYTGYTPVSVLIWRGNLKSWFEFFIKCSSSESVQHGVMLYETIQQFLNIQTLLLEKCGYFCT